MDVDGDNDLDLYVGTGLHAIRMSSFESDRLYRNENGKFIKDKNLFTNTNNTSCVKPYDYDNDGDIDLFVGNRSNPNDFGSEVPSFLLTNDGTGNFTPDPSFKLSAMVTDAVWEDLNKDGLKDLIVTTEWDAPKIYWNQKGTLTLANEGSKLLGLWQTVTTFDIDKDGDLDILLGNWGLNTKFKATASKPLLMYHSDFDANGKPETVLAYNKNGVYYPINSKDELASQMNIIKKRFIKYKDFAMQPIEKVLTTEAIAKAEKYTVNELSSGYLENENGTFTQFIKFPKALQLGPINSFKEINYKGVPHVLVFGNSKAVNTYHGGYESNKGLLLRDNKHHEFLSDLGVEPVNSQVKLSEIVDLKNEKLLLIISNNDTIQQYKINKK